VAWAIVGVGVSFAGLAIAMLKLSVNIGKTIGIIENKVLEHDKSIDELWQEHHKHKEYCDTTTNGFFEDLGALKKTAKQVDEIYKVIVKKTIGS